MKIKLSTWLSKAAVGYNESDHERTVRWTIILNLGMSIYMRRYICVYILFARFTERAFNVNHTKTKTKSLIEIYVSLLFVYDSTWNTQIIIQWIVAMCNCLYLTVLKCDSMQQQQNIFFNQNQQYTICISSYHPENTRRVDNNFPLVWYSTDMRSPPPLEITKRMGQMKVEKVATVFSFSFW